LFLFLHREEGQGLAEYGLILSLIFMIAIVAVFFMGGQLSSLLSSIGQRV
jgi:Flp pilus assembly pilin Flp